MCGRYTLSNPDQMLDELASAPAGLDTHGIELSPRFNIAPTQSVAAVCGDPEGGRHLTLLHWGLVPFWAKDEKIGNRMINARSETVHEKPSFRNAYKKRRCLVMTDGFYEWQKRPGGKQPFHIRMPGQRPFAFAGLWERWDKGETPLESCTILTTRANDTIAPVHDRMPVILEGEARDLWLDPEAPREALETLLHPLTSETLELQAVSRLVNNPRNDVPDCLKPVEL